MVSHLLVGCAGQAHSTGFADALEPRGDIDAVAHQIAVALFDDVAEMNADAEFNAAVLRHAGVALDHAVLHLDRASHGVDDAAEFDELPSPVRLTMRRGGRIVGSIRSLRRPRSRASVRSSSAPASRL